MLIAKEALEKTQHLSISFMLVQKCFFFLTQASQISKTASELENTKTSDCKRPKSIAPPRRGPRQGNCTLARQGADIDADNLSVAVSRSASRSRRAQASAPRDSVGGTRGNHSLPILPPPSAKKPALDSPSRGE